MMKWGSTVEDLRKHLARQPAFPHMRGDFVRAEARGFDPVSGVVGRKANAKKTDVLAAHNCIVQIMVRVVAEVASCCWCLGARGPPSPMASLHAACLAANVALLCCRANLILLRLAPTLPRGLRPRGRR
jgi:hypothetical protein